MGVDVFVVDIDGIFDDIEVDDEDDVADSPIVPLISAGALDSE